MRLLTSNAEPPAGWASAACQHSCGPRSRKPPGACQAVGNQPDRRASGQRECCRRVRSPQGPMRQPRGQRTPQGRAGRARGAWAGQMPVAEQAGTGRQEGQKQQTQHEAMLTLSCTGRKHRRAAAAASEVPAHHHQSDGASRVLGDEGGGNTVERDSLASRALVLKLHKAAVPCSL